MMSSSSEEQITTLLDSFFPKLDGSQLNYDKRGFWGFVPEPGAHFILTGFFRQEAGLLIFVIDSVVSTSGKLPRRTWLQPKDNPNFPLKKIHEAVQKRLNRLRIDELNRKGPPPPVRVELARFVPNGQLVDCDDGVNVQEFGRELRIYDTYGNLIDVTVDQIRALGVLIAKHWPP